MATTTMNPIADAVTALTRQVAILDGAIAVHQAHRAGLAQAIELLGGLAVPAVSAGTEDQAPGRRPRSIGSRTPLTEIRAALLKALADHGPHGAGALAVLCGDHKSRVKGELTRMSAERLVYSEGLRRGQRWHLGARPLTRVSTPVHSVGV